MMNTSTRFSEGRHIARSQPSIPTPLPLVVPGQPSAPRTGCLARAGAGGASAGSPLSERGLGSLFFLRGFFLFDAQSFFLRAFVALLPAPLLVCLLFSVFFCGFSVSSLCIDVASSYSLWLRGNKNKSSPIWIEVSPIMTETDRLTFVGCEDVVWLSACNALFLLSCLHVLACNVL